MKKIVMTVVAAAMILPVGAAQAGGWGKKGGYGHSGGLVSVDLGDLNVLNGVRILNGSPILSGNVVSGILSGNDTGILSGIGLNIGNHSYSLKKNRGKRRR